MNNIKNISNPQSLFSATLTISITILASRLIAIINNSIIASKFGTSIYLDSYLASQSIIDLFVALLTITMNVVFIPYIMELISNKDEEGVENLINSFFTLFAFVSLFFTIIILFFSYLLSKQLYPHNQLASNITQYILNISSISFTPLILSSFFINIFNSKKQFIVPSLANLVTSIFPAIFVLLFSSKISIYSLPLGNLFSTICSLIILFLYFQKYNIKIKLKINFNDYYFRKILKISIPLLFSASAVQINILCDRYFGARLQIGSISALNYARIIRDIPLTLVSALPLSILPYFSEISIMKADKKLSDLLAKTLKIGTFILLPSVFGLYVLAPQLIAILFKRGNYNSVSSEYTLNALELLLPGMIFYWFIQIITRLFYAKKEFSIVIKMGIGSILFNIFADLLLSRILSYRGLALSTSLMEILFCLVYFYLLNNKLVNFNYGNILISFFKILISSILMAIAVCILKNKIVYSNNIMENIQIMKLFFEVLVGIFIYLIFSKLFKITELDYLFRKIKSMYHTNE